jgi:hypothetical protein
MNEQIDPSLVIVPPYDVCCVGNHYVVFLLML